MQKKIVSGLGRLRNFGGITQTLLSSKVLYLCMYDGLTMKNGRLINERPNGITGIQEALNIKKTLKRAEKIQMYSEAVSLGVQKAENVEDMNEMFLK